jgi:L-ascorbate oxidase
MGTDSMATSHRHHLWQVALVVVLLPALAGPARAQSAPSRVVANPPLLNDIGKAAPSSASSPTALVSSPSNEVALDLNLVYMDGQVWNPATNRFDLVRARSYQGTGVDPGGLIISPTIEMRPGQTIRMTLNNRLPADPTCVHVPANVNIPHCFSSTNMHTHGLWTNPSGNGDNVLISINPGVSFQYEYNVPPDHPSGTFWYHSHLHGSTALQVSSGMAGALIIRGDRQPTTVASGDIDTLLRPTESQPMIERVVVLQQIHYACRDASGAIKVDSVGNWRCDPGDVGGIENYDVFNFPGWSISGHYTSINGLVLPTFSGSRAGQFERWRVVHGGVGDTINLQFRKQTAPLNTAGLRAADSAAAIDQSCGGAPVPQYVYAADGITLAAIQTTDLTVFQPGYRWDALIQFPEPGTYCVINGAGAASVVGQQGPSRQLLGFVTVIPGNTVPFTPMRHLQNVLIEAAYQAYPVAVRDRVVNDLLANLKLTSFVPHPDIGPDEVTGQQLLAFNIDFSSGPPRFLVDSRPFDPSRVDRTLTLGGVDEWTLKSDFIGHPFHIHVNPFQVVRILDPSGRDVSGPDAVDNFGGVIDTQYRGMRGVWKDTLWVKNGAAADASPAELARGVYTVIVRTRYRRYIGDFVLHCHILDHEDQGMMQNVRIALPGASVHGAHKQQ